MNANGFSTQKIYARVSIANLDFLVFRALGSEPKIHKILEKITY